MRVSIIDDNHIMLVASEREAAQYTNHSRVLIDDKNSFVCSSEPSSLALSIERPVGGSLLNIELNIGPRFNTKEFLIVYLEMDDLTYPFVFPCYDNEILMDTVAKSAGILDATIDCECTKDINVVYPIIIYYGFKLALATYDIRTAIQYWDRLFGPSDNPAFRKCGCHG